MADDPYSDHDRQRIDDILALLADVARGTYRKLDDDLPESDPFGLLYRGINESVASLADIEERTRRYERELEEKLELIERQRLAIRELSTPVIQVWQGVLCIPIVGVIDTMRSAEMTEAVLAAVMKENTRCVFIDITGVEVMDTRTTDQLIRLARVIRLLDTRCFLVGLRPAIAQTLDQMGVDLSMLAIRRNLRDGLREYLTAVARTRPAVPTNGRRKG